eukprot:g1533.t1
MFDGISENTASNAKETSKTTKYFAICGIVCLVCILVGSLVTYFTLESSGSFSKVGRFNDTSNLNQVQIVNRSNLGVFIGYGQSNSDCCGLTGYVLRHPDTVFQFGQNKTWTYNDPMLGAWCHLGCVYGPIGDRLIDLGRFEKTVFATTGMPGAQLSMLNQGDAYFGYLVKTYKEMNDTFGKVDGVLYHQGESDHGRSSSYFEKFETLLSNLRDEGIDESTGLKMYVSRATYCANSVDNDLSAVQQDLASQLSEVYEGPNTDLLQGSEYRFDNCHFTVSGFERIAEMWGDIL